MHQICDTLPAPQPASPPELENVNPRIVMTSMGDKMTMKVTWPKGAELTAFANMIVHMHQGLLKETVNHAIEAAGYRQDEVEKANSLRGFINQNMERINGKQPPKPVVSPLRTFRHLSKNTLS